MPTNNKIVAKATDPIQTAMLTSGLLNPEQARKFIQQTFDATNLGGLIRHEMRRAKSGEIFLSSSGAPSLSPFPPVSCSLRKAYPFAPLFAASRHF